MFQRFKDQICWISAVAWLGTFKLSIINFGKFHLLPWWKSFIHLWIMNSNLRIYWNETSLTSREGRVSLSLLSSQNRNKTGWGFSVIIIHIEIEIEIVQSWNDNWWWLVWLKGRPCHFKCVFFLDLRTLSVYVMFMLFKKIVYFLFST